jgi:AcrR family transcriptional regulator
MRIMAESGVSSLSLREVARRLDVSHQAPYKHFQSRDHLLAEAIGRIYEELGHAIDSGPPMDRPDAELGEIGKAYLRFAAEKPLHYRLLFEFPITELAAFEGIEAKAAVAFDRVLKVVSRLTEVEDEDFNRECALFAWSCVHGLASLCANQVLPAVGFHGEGSQVSGTLASLEMVCGAIKARATARQATG